ncbi:proton myo-inositol cotransporter-like [Liolophura sinensis]|uniref:proton myo-inositol cotransporter-like n=1 Tax=Liolophura sinensis TaxID=3198878 RepID=UPI00315898F5
MSSSNNLVTNSDSPEGVVNGGFTQQDVKPVPGDTSANGQMNSGDNLSGDKKQPEEPPAKTTFYVILLTFLCALGSFLFGYDTGVVSGAMLYIKDEFHLSPLLHELVISVTVGAAAVFAVVGGFINDKLGRKPTTLIASVVFLAGALVLALAQNVAMLLAGRVIVGIGIGLDSMTVPMYVAECAPAHVRGRLVTIHQFMITVGLLVSTLVDGAFSYVDNGWRYMLGLAGVPALIQLIGFIFMPESPRWLVYHDKDEEGLKALEKIRGTTQVLNEYQLIKDTVNEDRKLQNENQGFVLLRMLKTKTTRRALVVGCSLQMFQQLAGINTVMYYTASIVRMAGFRDNSIAIWLSALVSSVNVLFTFVGLYFVEKLGRKLLLILSYIGVLVALIVLAVGFQLPSISSPDLNMKEGFSNTSCYSYSNCYPCSQDAKCGYCYEFDGNVASNGSCVAVLDDEHTAQATIGRCNSTSLPDGMRFDFDFCPTDYSWLPIFGMVLYLASFAPGFAPMPWTLNSEMYPLWARSSGNACATAVNWLFNLLVSQTFLTLLESMTSYGTYWLYAGISVIGISVFTMIVPETKGKSLEEIEQLFSKGWCHCPCMSDANAIGSGRQKTYELEIISNQN